MFVKDPVIKTELDQYDVWYQLRKTMLMENRDFDQITSSERQTLENLALDYFFTSAGKKAVAYLDFNEGGWFIPPAYDSEQQFAFRSAELEKPESFTVKVYPNPVSVMVNFELTNELQKESDLTLTIYDGSGRLIHSQVVKSYESLVTLKTDNWACKKPY